MDNRELTLAGLLADPMTLALMAADKVDLAELTATWTAVARVVERRPEPARAQCVHLTRGYLTW
jgi:hypothetical protein